METDLSAIGTQARLALAAIRAETLAPNFDMQSDQHADEPWPPLAEIRENAQLSISARQPGDSQSVIAGPTQSLPPAENSASVQTAPVAIFEAQLAELQKQSRQLEAIERKLDVNETTGLA